MASNFQAMLILIFKMWRSIGFLFFISQSKKKLARHMKKRKPSMLKKVAQNSVQIAAAP
jgi:hypothetical protein